MTTIPVFTKTPGGLEFASLIYLWLMEAIVPYILSTWLILWGFMISLFRGS